MSSPALDLPDSQQPPVPPGGADDLLSQMAGQEIDRMLADAANDSTPTPPPAVSDLPFEPIQPHELERVFTKFEAERAAESKVAPMRRIPLPPETASASTEIKPQPPLPEPVPISTPEIKTSSEIETTESERAALHDAPPTELADPITASESPHVVEVESKPSVLVRFLELLNAPFAAVPDTARDLFGKLAILTILNSMGLMLYVLIFRR